jgi:hypothetical protein
MCYGILNAWGFFFFGQVHFFLFAHFTLKKKAPKQRREKKQEVRTKVQGSKQPKRSRPQGGKGTTKNSTLHPNFSHLIKKKNCVKNK